MARLVIFVILFDICFLLARGWLIRQPGESAAQAALRMFKRDFPFVSPGVFVLLIASICVIIGIIIRFSE